MKDTKKVFGIILLSFATIGIIVALSFQFDLDLFKRDGNVFDWQEGSNSNLPLFYGLCAIAGAYLLGQVKSEK